MSGLDDKKCSRFILRNLKRAFQDAKREQALDKSKNEGRSREEEPHIFKVCFGYKEHISGSLNWAFQDTTGEQTSDKNKNERQSREEEM